NIGTRDGRVGDSSAHTSHNLGTLRIRDVDDLPGNVGVGARDGHASSGHWQVHASNDHGTLWIRDFDDLQSGIAVRQVEVRARDDSLTRSTRRIQTSHNLGILWI